MTTTALARPKPQKAQQGLALKAWEYVVYCRHCKTFETVWFTDNGLVQTRKFHQVDNLVYHDCGAKEPCRLLPRFVKGEHPEPAYAATR
ncbi:MAG: hypothetical protein HY670_01890 [Chloroflexi bacterium]|nr:hypothetical protein [Chloroflexota bacterium]